ncbi:testis-specific serine/threonine-protein kinase 3-like [Anoplophora glabripennis]|uniref:testis-specific serine/threonine-protein kinase 3-like n=1 Tax=Anoplophora glabripennis TaxID=217634 RepID=UPI0008751EB8|nr:testis-specific serine/threonine-protein kinase 3-like [Anoplophora glabripennis]
MSKRQKRCAFSIERSTQKLFHTIGYRIGKSIGKGTYSKVCIAINSLGQKLACKIINKRYAGEDFIQKFLPRELRIITAIKHPNIVTVYKILEINDVIYMFMDYCKNGDLLEYIRQHGSFSEDKARTIFRQIVSAVHYLHNLDISHRDLKCENVFLTATDQVKLGDFGFARFCKNEFGNKILSNTFCGSAAYAAPEILQGVFYDPKMYDIWALGCILYVMMSASMPFDDSNIKRMVKDQMSRSIFAVTLLWSDHSIDLKKLINSLLEPDMLKRATITQVAKSGWLEEGSFKKIKRLLSISESSLF